MCEKIGWLLVGAIIGVAVGYHLNEAVEFELTARQMAEARLAAEKAAAKKDDDLEMVDPEIEKELTEEVKEDPVNETSTSESVTES